MKILVTGASGGIGARLVNDLVMDGHDVTATYFSNAPRQSDVKLARYIHADLSTSAGQEEFVKQLDDFDCYIHCSGVAEVAKVGELDLAKLREMYEINVFSFLTIANRLLPRFMEIGFGRIVLIGSIVADYGGIGLAGYSSTKLSLEAVSKSINKEIQQKKRDKVNSDVTINVIKPGYVNSRMTSALSEKIIAKISDQSVIKRFLFADEVTDAIKFLIRKESCYISGSMIDVNGGQTL